MRSAPVTMTELYEAAMQIMYGPRTAQRGIREIVVDIVNLAVAYERERVAQQILARLRSRSIDPGSPEAAELASLLQYVEDKDATVQMGDGDG